MIKRPIALLLVVVMSLALSILSAFFLVNVLDWRYSFGLAAPLGEFESLLVYMVLGSMVFPHVFGIPYMAMVLRDAKACDQACA